MNLMKLNRKIHKWGALVIALPLIMVIGSGILLMLKKEVSWIQPKTLKGASYDLSVSFDRILEAASSASEAEIKTWEDVDRLDVRPSKGIVKVRSKNRVEVQVDTSTGRVLQVAKRNSDLIESIHDGSFFFEKAKFWIFFPSCLVLLLLWVTGICLFLYPYIRKKTNSSQKNNL